jgi:hypothetical protein
VTATSSRYALIADGMDGTEFRGKTFGVTFDSHAQGRVIKLITLVTSQAIFRLQRKRVV